MESGILAFWIRNFHGGQLKFWGEGGSRGRNFCGSGRWLLEVFREVSIVQEEVFYLIFTKLFNVSFNAIISGPGLQDFCVRDNNCHDERLERELKLFIYLFIFPIPSDMSLALESLHSEIIFFKKMRDLSCTYSLTVWPASSPFSWHACKWNILTCATRRKSSGWLGLGKRAKEHSSLSLTLSSAFRSPADVDQHQFSHNHVHMIPIEIVMRVNKMITEEKMHWSVNKLSQLTLEGNVWRSVWRIYMWILGL